VISIELIKTFQMMYGICGLVWFGKTKVISNQKWCYAWVDTGGPVVYPWVTHRNPCPMNLYFLNWVKYARCYNISKPQGLKDSINQVIDL